MKSEDTGRMPLVIVDRAGKIVDVSLMNRKCFTKSTEQGELWVLHAETGRVLPYEGGVQATLADRGRWYEATVGEDPRMHAVGPAPKPSTANGRAEAGGAPAPADGELDLGAVLRELSAVIRRRRSERPEGSYTTYLFDAGEEKIRKKTGEEAIELVLARSREEVVSEASDLIYHLLVLLNQLDIPLDDVFGELVSRA